MKIIKKIEIDGAVKLSPMEMNKIHFDSGKHSEASQTKKQITLA